MRIATGGISHETSSFAPTPTRLREFETGLGMFRGGDMVERFRGTNNCTGGFIAGAQRHGFELIPLLWTFAYPGGLIPRNDYEALKTEFLERLSRAVAEGGPVDGVLLDLHGAMVVEEIDDADGDFLAAVRGAVGPDCPIVATFDLHGNHTQRRLDAATALVGFDTYPHVDMAERGQEATDLIVRTIRGEIRPVMALRELPLFWSAACQATGHPPIDEAFRLVHEVERRPGILTVTLATGFPWADVPQMGASVIVVADRDRDLARATADEIGDWVWQRRQRWHRPPPSVIEALDLGEKEGRYPIILADMADNTGGGAPGDSTEVLRTFVEKDLRDALVLYLVDPEVAGQAHAAGIGKRIQVEMGGKSHPVQGPPLALEVEVIALSDGKFTYDGPMYAGLTGDQGLSAWLRHRGVNVVVVSARMQPLDRAFARSLGIDAAAMRYIAVKSAVHFRSGFEQIAGSIHNVDARALHTHDFARLPYRHRRRPMFPLEDGSSMSTMGGFRVAQLDHVEFFVPDRYEAAAWYARTLGLQIVPEYAHWANDPEGPLMIASAVAGTKLALFAGEPQGARPTAGFYRVAFRVGRRDFETFLNHVGENPVFGEQGEEVRKLAVRDHGAARSVYFRDPYGHRLEVTTYEVAATAPTGGKE